MTEKPDPKTSSPGSAVPRIEEPPTFPRFSPDLVQRVRLAMQQSDARRKIAEANVFAELAENERQRSETDRALRAIQEALQIPDPNEEAAKTNVEAALEQLEVSEMELAEAMAHARALRTAGPSALGIVAAPEDRLNAPQRNPQSQAIEDDLGHEEWREVYIELIRRLKGLASPDEHLQYVRFKLASATNV